jgi:hypothetical protein
MVHEDLPSEDSDLDRIRARIRYERFDVFHAWSRWKWWCSLAGAVCGMAGGMWLAVARYNALATARPVDTNWFITSAIQIVVVCTLLGGLVGLAIPGLPLVLFLTMRPIYVAIFRSTEEFDRDYPDSRK